MRKTIYLALTALVMLCANPSYSQERDGSLYHYNGQGKLVKDTLFKMNPATEIKKGVIIHSSAIALFAGTTILNPYRNPHDLQEKQWYAISYGTAAVAFFVGTVYVIQGINYTYKPNNMGNWSFKFNPVTTTIAYNF